VTKDVVLTPQPHIWPGLPIGLAWGVDTDHYITSQAVCLDCGWRSDWARTTNQTHDAGFAHLCGALW
jgi:hypothetical protein